MMQTYQFDEIVVNHDGVVTIAGLPPKAKVAVMVITDEPKIVSDNRDFLRGLSAGHYFEVMSPQEFCEAFAL